MNNSPCVRGLPNETARAVAAAAHSVLAELGRMSGEQLVVRPHTDARSELLEWSGCNVAEERT
eukprot:1923045-Prorocentrum_lima.AAC.1